MTQNRNNEIMNFVMKNSPKLLHLKIKSCSFIWGNVRYNFRLIGVDLGSSRYSPRESPPPRGPKIVKMNISGFLHY